MPLETFYQVFRVIDNNTLQFVYRTKVGDLTFDANAPLKKGAIIGGIDFFKFIGNNIEVTQLPDGTRVIDRIYLS